MEVEKPTNAPPAISLRNLRKVYRSDESRGTVALAGLNLDIAAGEVYGLIGPNGAGKSTLLRIIATLQEPTYGDVRIAGFDSQSERNQVCARLGFMPELFALYEELTVAEYLMFFAMSHRIDPRERARTIESVIELTDLGVRRDSYAGELSKGMRQRLLLAKTLIHDPEVLLLDEPTSGMDPQARIEFRNIVKTLRKMGKTIVLSSHILSDLSQLCTSFGILEQGCMRVSGSLEAVTRQIGLRAELRCEFLPDGADPEPVLEKHALASGIRRAERNVRFFLDGGPAEQAAVLALLVSAGVKVTSFIEKRSDLEDVFMELGATKVQ
ncbi:MAG: ABC transporter ATP-binding protein [Planctomycetota bacterium]